MDKGETPPLLAPHSRLTHFSCQTDFDKANEILFRLGIIYKQQQKYTESLDVSGNKANAEAHSKYLISASIASYAVPPAHSPTWTYGFRSDMSMNNRKTSVMGCH